MNYQVRRPSLEALFREVDNFSPKKEKLQPPRIGISSNRKDAITGRGYFPRRVRSYLA